MSVRTLGTIVRMSDGRTGTVVYNGLDGVGVKWGEHNPNPADFAGTTGGLFSDDVPDDWPWRPDAILRQPWNGCERMGWLAEQCVGDEYEIVREGGSHDRQAAEQCPETAARGPAGWGRPPRRSEHD